MVGKKLKLDENRSIPMSSTNNNNNSSPIDDLQLINQTIKNFRLDDDQKTQLIKDLKALNLKSWFSRSDHEVIKLNNYLNYHLSFINMLKLFPLILKID